MTARPEPPGLPPSTFVRKQYRHPTRSFVAGAYVLDDDDRGTWLFRPAGSRSRQEQAGLVVDEATTPVAVLFLLPATSWWVAKWHTDGLLYIDVSRPCRQVDGEWRFVDLYLDVYRRRGSDPVLDDEDEFAEACAAGQLDDEERAVARASADAVFADVGADRAPFDADAWRRLDAAVARGLPPLAELPPLLAAP